MNLALFDFDGTITKNDSFVDFIFFAHGKTKTILGVVLLSPVVLLYLLKIIPNWKTKEIFLKYFFGDWKEKDFNTTANNFSLNQIPKLVKPSALDRIEWHKKRGDTVAVVSASLESYLKEWCQKNGLELIATKIELNNGLVTGKLSTKNCYGHEKINRIKEKFNLEKFDYVYAYGDSPADKVLEEIADEFHYRSFK